MAKKDTSASPREDRLKAALKANLARRKAQAKARAAEAAQTTGGESSDGQDSGKG